jgi:CheY-like chemotaxis protein
MKVLLVEDDASLREGMGEIVAELAEVRATASETEALAALRAERFDLVITDLRIANREQGGRTVLEAARRKHLAVAIVSAAVPEEVARALRPHVPDALLGKPFQLDDIVALVERFKAVCEQVEALATARALPPDNEWRELAPGVRVAGEGGDGPLWVRMAPGSSFTWQLHPQRPECLRLLEGEVELEGELHTGPRYAFLGASQTPAATSRVGCLAVTLALKA